MNEEERNLNLDEEEPDWELESVRTHIMRFKWLADGSKNWNEVITRIQERIRVIRALMKAGAYIMKPTWDDYLRYQIPGEYSTHATYLGIKADKYQFHLPNGRIVTYPVDPKWTSFNEATTGKRVTVLINRTGEIVRFFA